jgi:hypothetical protein
MYGGLRIHYLPRNKRNGRRTDKLFGLMLLSPYAAVPAGTFLFYTLPLNQSLNFYLSARQCGR